MFSKEYEFRYGDLDKNGNIKIGAMMELLQDISFAHASFVGWDWKDLKDESVACLLGGWRVRIKKPLDESCVTVKTGVMSIRKYEALRKYEIWQNDECKVIATALWFTVDIKLRKIIPVPQSFIDAFECIDEEDNGLTYEKLRPNKDLIFLDEFKVSASDIDTNNHLNNVKSVEKMLNLLPDNFEIMEFCIRYRKEIKADECVKIYGSQNDKKCCFEIRNDDGLPCVWIDVNRK